MSTVAAQTYFSLCSYLISFTFSLLSLGQLKVIDWKLLGTLMPIDVGLPRVLHSTLKHFSIRFFQEPLKVYSGK
ncbi:hypothetical protein [cyanobacterium endosymbiont of Epithemia clementina EcSB]|uniref:hypothetical protein n=1 Tax=cyanobacterium endosymbiont of Epithemia clementina EcSB TaxID=3034674 RepID=UPI00386BC45E